jgi:hypothetical protein
MEGSETTIPRPFEYTSELAVPRSMARSLEKSERRDLGDQAMCISCTAPLAPIRRGGEQVFMGRAHAHRAPLSCRPLCEAHLSYRAGSRQP